MFVIFNNFSVWPTDNMKKIVCHKGVWCRMKLLLPVSHVSEVKGHNLYIIEIMETVHKYGEGLSSYINFKSIISLYCEYLWIIGQTEWANDSFSMSSELFFSFIMERTSFFWWDNDVCFEMVLDQCAWLNS